MTVFSERLSRALEARGVTQGELSRMLGVHKQAVSRWARGETEPLVSTAGALADILDVDLAWLAGQVDRKGVPRSRA